MSKNHSFRPGHSVAHDASFAATTDFHWIPALCSGFLLLALVIGGGCGPKAPKILTLDEVASELDTQFAKASEALTSMAQPASRALREQQFSQAFAMLQALQTQSENMSARQRETVRSALYSLQQKMGEAAAAGDPDAGAAIEALRLTR